MKQQFMLLSFFLFLSFYSWSQKVINRDRIGALKDVQLTLNTDYGTAPQATPAEIEEFNQIRNNQQNVGVIGGENIKPFYYHANQPNEVVYKYQKLIDAARLPSSFFDWAKGKLRDKVPLIGGALGTLAGLAQDALNYVESWFSSSSTNTWVDCWYPTSEFKRTVCGKMNSKSFICSQDYLHTRLTVDKDVNLEITPAPSFSWALQNRWLSEQKESIEGEVRVKNLNDLNTNNGQTSETIIPRNPLLLQIAKDQAVCLYGPWMADILDINANVPIPFTDDHIDLGKVDLNTNNEIHPVNQLWFKKGNETDLIAIADGNGYFEKTGNGEIEASGIHHPMRFYLAFSFMQRLPLNTAALSIRPFAEYQVNGIGYDFTEHPTEDIKEDSLTLIYNGSVRLKVYDNSFVRLQKTHHVFFDKVRNRADGLVQGYIVIETEPMNLRGGSVNIIVNETPAVTSGVKTTVSGIRTQ